MTITAPQPADIDDLARAMDIPSDAVASLFAFLDDLRRGNKGEWPRDFMVLLIEKAREGNPWATEVLRAMAGKALEAVFGPAGVPGA